MGQTSAETNVTQRRRAMAWVAAAVLLTWAGLNASEAAQAELPSLPPASSPIPIVAEQARPTLAWSRFCEQRPAECDVDLSETERVPLSAEIWHRLVTINRTVNDAVRPVTDWEHWGVEDRWDYPDDGAGDCEDIQLLKRRRLIDAGVPRRVLRMTVVLDENRSGHAVLTIVTDRGDFILDNKRADVLPWDATGYEFLKREGSNGPQWVTLERAPILVSAADPLSSLPPGSTDD